MLWGCTAILKIYAKDKQQEWNKEVRSYKNWDIYYLFEYANSFSLHGDGEPFLISYKDDNVKFCYAVMMQDIAQCEAFKSILMPETYYDLETPYGYGGVLCDKDIPEASQKKFLSEMEDYCIQNKIISQFIRFHPVLANYDQLDYVTEKKYMRDTIYIDTSSPELILSNMDSKNRNMVRKAKKSNVTVIVKPITEYKDFLEMYIETMKNNNAEDYYTFNEDYFKELKKMEENACIFYALLDEIPISGAIMYYNDKFMHYHLSGSHFEYRKYSSGNLLLYEAACWASERGIRVFHLGGGMALDDSLFGFKKQFNKNGRLSFYIGRTIFDKVAYDELLELRKKVNLEFNKNNNFMIQYRGS